MEVPMLGRVRLAKTSELFAPKCRHLPTSCVSDPVGPTVTSQTVRIFAGEYFDYKLCCNNLISLLQYISNARIFLPVTHNAKLANQTKQTILVLFLEQSRSKPPNKIESGDVFHGPIFETLPATSFSGCLVAIDVKMFQAAPDF
jgi:hypothetical protein